MIHTAFTKAYNQLNPQQKQAVDQIEGAVMVIAGPGTGKTQMLTLRIAKILLETDVQPENILALTFTEAGVTAMRKRLVSIIGATAYRVNIFTFHGLANQCIQNYPENFPHLINAHAITEIEQVEVLEKILLETPLNLIKSFADPFVYLSAAKSSITELKRENITPDKFEQILDQQRQDLEASDGLYHQKGRYKGEMKVEFKKAFKNIDKNKELLQIYRLYQSRLLEQKLYDYEDMLLELIAQLETNEYFKFDLQEQYQYFLVDEHQDTNRAQNRIIELLAGYHDNPNIFAVGDEKQAIYRFQGASLTNFLYLKQNYPEAKVISLSDNYRSTQVILDVAHSLIQKLPLPSIDLPLRDNLQANANSTQTQIEIVDIADPFGEYYYVAQDIKVALQAGVPAQEIAILARNNADLNEIIPVLAQSQIPYVLRSNQNILADLNLQKMINLLRLVTNPGIDMWLLKSLVSDISHVHPLDVFRLQGLAKEGNVSAWQVLAKADFSDPNWIEPQTLQAWYEKLITWISTSNNQHPDETFSVIFKDSGLLDLILSRPEMVESLDRFVTLFNQLRSKQSQNPKFSLKDFVAYIDLVEAHNLKLSGNHNSGQVEAVQLMTAHGSKGLEFDRVYILNCYDQKWGRSRAGGIKFKLPYEYMQIVAAPELVKDDLADERRLFYVALTRARSHVTISYAKFKADGREQSPSQFIEELDRDLITPTDTKDFEAEWSASKERVFAQAKQKILRADEIQASLKPMINHLFAQQGFSVSALNNYLNCPWKYFFRNLLRIPETKTLSLVFGTATHAAINRWISQRGDATSVVAYFKDYLNTRPLNEVEKAELVETASRVLPNYFSQRMCTWPSTGLISELNISGVGVEPDIKLTGKLDLLIPLESDQYRVVDFKTGKPKSRNQILGKTKDSTGDYKRQLVFYQMLLDRYHNGKYQMVEAVLDFVQPNDSGKLKSELFVIEAEETKELEEVIRTSAAQIRDLDFWDKFCDDPDCDYCKLRKLMGTA